MLEIRLYLNAEEWPSCSHHQQHQLDMVVAVSKMSPFSCLFCLLFHPFISLNVELKGPPDPSLILENKEIRSLC